MFALAQCADNALMMMLPKIVLDSENFNHTPPLKTEFNNESLSSAKHLYKQTSGNKVIGLRWASLSC